MIIIIINFMMITGTKQEVYLLWVLNAPIHSIYYPFFLLYLKRINHNNVPRALDIIYSRGFLRPENNLMDYSMVKKGLGRLL